MAALYIFLSSLVALATIVTFFSSSTLYVILGLLCVLLSMATLFFWQGAAFVAVAQILVYGSGALLLFLYSTLLPPSSAQLREKLRGGLVVLAAGLMLGPMAWTTGQVLEQRGVVDVQHDAVAHLGLQLAAPYILAFEWVGFMLLVALVGVATIIPSAKQQGHDV